MRKYAGDLAQIERLRSTIDMTSPPDIPFHGQATLESGTFLGSVLTTFQ